jgi:putative membrane protein
VLNPQDEKRIGDAIRAAETKTAGEIVCVLARSSSDYSAVPVLWAALAALACPWPLIWLTDWTVTRIFGLQGVVFVVAALLFSVPWIRIRLVPVPVKRIRAHRAAMEQFFARGLTRTRQRRGLMIFVSWEERYIRVVADDGIAAKVPDEAWKPVVAALAAEIRQGHIVAGFESAIAMVGEILAGPFPPTEDRDELPDKIYVL